MEEDMKYPVGWEKAVPFQNEIDYWMSQAPRVYCWNEF